MSDDDESLANQLRRHQRERRDSPMGRAVSEHNEDYSYDQFRNRYEGRHIRDMPPEELRELAVTARRQSNELLLGAVTQELNQRMARETQRDYEISRMREDARNRQRAEAFLGEVRDIGRAVGRQTMSYENAQDTIRRLINDRGMPVTNQQDWELIGRAFEQGRAEAPERGRNHSSDALNYLMTVRDPARRRRGFPGFDEWPRDPDRDERRPHIQISPYRPDEVKEDRKPEPKVKTVEIPVPGKRKLDI